MNAHVHWPAVLVKSAAICATLSGALLPMEQAAANSTPGPGAVGVSRLCGPREDYGCTTGGYAGSEAWGYYTTWGSTDAAGGRHNCTSYVAFKLDANGVPKPAWYADAIDWDERARAQGLAVDGVPAVGAVAQWNSGVAGHVAYVESVADTYIETTEDNYGLNTTNRYRIERGSDRWPDNFIHFMDLGTSTIPDGASDVIARRTDGLLFVYPANGTGGWKSGGIQIGTGWNQFNAIIGAGDFNGDHIAGDVIARRTDGLLFVYPANGTGGWKSGGIQIGTGWNQFNAIIGAGDFNGDHIAGDVIARRTDGLLFVYPANGTGGWKSGGIQIGTGWNQFNAIIGAGDFNGDHIAGDVIARRTDGLLFVYPANGTGGWKSGGIQIGTGWNQFNAIIGAGDFNGDHIAGDVIARRTDGLLFVYPANGTGGWKSGGIQIGTGWNQFNAIIGAGDFGV